MAYYINSASSSDALTRDIKELVPAPEVRRRMSRVLRMGVAAGMDALAALPSGVQVNAMITATRLGCLADSEKFLRGVVEQEPESELGGVSLSPTPFIQSTFNTVGAQIALLTANHCYNMTYVHGEESLDHALLDAAIQIDACGAEHVLVGVFDEATPTRDKIVERMGGWRGDPVDGGTDWNGLPAGDGARFFVVSARPLEGCLAEVGSLEELKKWLRQ